jgi:CO/xanthine dehydrogenase Mo-binding subunit
MEGQLAVGHRLGNVILEKLTLVVDAGTVVHPDGALAQVEGAALWGASLALHEGSEFVKGRVKDTNLDTYTPLRMGDVPKMDIEFLPSRRGWASPPPPWWPGDRKRHIATGARLRHLPIRPDAVLRALKTTS